MVSDAISICERTLRLGHAIQSAHSDLLFAENSRDGRALVGNSIAWAIVTTAACTTRCSSSRSCGPAGNARAASRAHRSHTGPSHASMQACKDGAGVCALMHTCRSTRKKMAQAFEPLSVQRAQPDSVLPADSHFRWADPYVAYFQEMLEQFLEALSSGSLISRAQAQQHLPDLDDVLVAEEEASDLEKVGIGVSYRAEKLYRVDCQREPGQPLRQRDARLAFDGAPDGLLSSSSFNALGIYNRARRGTFKASPLSGSVILITILYTRSGKVCFRSCHWSMKAPPRQEATS